MTTLKDYTVARKYVAQMTPVHPAAMAIGDITSDAKGSGARANGGKPDLSLIPLGLLADILEADATTTSVERQSVFRALRALGRFQNSRRHSDLTDAMRELGIADGIAECAHVFTYGKAKYAAWNWAKGMPWSVPLACAARHLVTIVLGERNDPESGEPHRGHVFCNITMLMQYAMTYPEGDDLPPVGLLGPA